MWEVRIAGHEAAGRAVPAQVVKVPAISADHACRIVIGEAQRAAGCQPSKQCRRQSLAHATAKPCTAPGVQADLPDQLRIEAASHER
jgi:hypothetical protein